MFTYIVEWVEEGTLHDFWESKDWEELQNRIRSQLKKQPNWYVRISIRVGPER